MLLPIHTYRNIAYRRLYPSVHLVLSHLTDASKDINVIFYPVDRNDLGKGEERCPECERKFYDDNYLHPLQAFGCPWDLCTLKMCADCIHKAITASTPPACPYCRHTHVTAPLAKERKAADASQQRSASAEGPASVDPRFDNACDDGYGIFGFDRDEAGDETGDGAGDDHEDYYEDTHEDDHTDHYMEDGEEDEAEAWQSLERNDEPNEDDEDEDDEDKDDEDEKAWKAMELALSASRRVAELPIRPA